MRSPKVEDAILRRISEGETIAQISDTRGMPTASAWYNWLNRDPDLMARYVEAKEIGIERELDEIKTIVDAALPADGDLSAELRRRAQQVAARQYRIEKIMPKKYGARSQLVLEDHRTVPMREMSDDALDTEILELTALLTGGMVIDHEP